MAPHSINIDPTSVEFLLVAGRAVFLIFSFVLACVAFLAWRRMARTQTEQLLAQTNVLLQRFADLEARFDATRVTISELGQRIERPMQVTSTQTTTAPGYQIAIRLAKAGASREELMSGCGLSLNEAELVQRLHGPAASARRAAN